MQHPGQASFARRSLGSFDGVSPIYAASGTPYSPNSSSGSPMMHGYPQMQPADALPIGHMHVGMDLPQHNVSSMSQPNSVPPSSLTMHPQHAQGQHNQLEQQQQPMPVHMNPYLHHGPSNSNSQLNPNTPYTQSPIDVHPPSHMQLPPSTPASSARPSTASAGDTEAVNPTSIPPHSNGGPIPHRSQTHPVPGPWGAPTPRISREPHHTHPMSHHSQQQMPMHMQRPPQPMPHPGYGPPYPPQQPHPPYSPVQQGPPQHGMAMPMHIHQHGLRLLDAYLLARAIQNATPRNESQSIIHYAGANGRNPNTFLRAYEQNRKEIDELVAQLRQEDNLLGNQHMSMSPVHMGMNMPPSQGMNGQPYPPSHMPPSIVSLQPPSGVPLPSSNGPLQPPNSIPLHRTASLPPSSGPPSFQRNPSAGTSELDVPSSEASSPMLETPTSASLPNGTGKGAPGMNLSASSSGANVAAHSASGAPTPATGAPAPPTIPDPPFMRSPSKPGSRDGEPYSASEIQLIEWVIREAIQAQPDIKLAQLGVLIHAKDPGRPATAWARQLSKRKNAIERAREVVRQGGSVREWVFEINGRGGSHTLSMSLGEGASIKEDDVSEDEGSRTRRAKREEDDDADYDERPSKRRRGS